ncbi:MAG: FAD-dependent oxidoreductase [Rhizobiales bacterium 62-47]|nr:MAG: FAD-dependent oxidoreductase [Rhizobiales bacterium 62-47]
MTTPVTSAPPDSETATAVQNTGARRRLTLDRDVEVCVIGAGLAGLTAALELSRKGMSVAVLEGRHVGWGASGRPLGTVMPGYGLPVNDIIARVGFDNAREMWALSRQGANYVRHIADKIGPELELSYGALEVSNVDIGDRLIGRLQMLGEDFGTEVEGWQVDHVRDVLRTRRYFHAVHYPGAFQIDGSKYLHGLAAQAEAAGARIYEETPALSIDAAGIRKRIVTPAARMRASHIVLAGNVYLGGPSQRLTDTLLPVWRYAAVSEPLGDRLAEVISFQGSVMDTDDIDHFRIVDGDRLMWAGPETTWSANPQRFAAAIRRRIRTVFPALGRVELADVWSGVVGQTVHGMPQIGQLRRGLWVASGFGRQGMSATALAGQLIANGILWRDDRWRLFSPFELVWAGGRAGRVAGKAVDVWTRGGAAAAGALARWRERAAIREAAREARLAAANRQAGTGH